MKNQEEVKEVKKYVNKITDEERDNEMYQEQDLGNKLNSSNEMKRKAYNHAKKDSNSNASSISENGVAVMENLKQFYRKIFDEITSLKSLIVNNSLTSMSISNLQKHEYDSTSSNFNLQFSPAAYATENDHFAPTQTSVSNCSTNICMHQQLLL